MKKNVTYRTLLLSVFLIVLSFNSLHVRAQSYKLGTNVLVQSISSDSKYVAYLSSNQRLYIVPTSGKQSPQTIDVPDYTAGEFQFSDDSKYLVFNARGPGRGDHLYSFSINNGDIKQLSNNNYSQFDISPDGKFVVYKKFSGLNGEIYSVPISGGIAIKLNASLPPANLNNCISLNCGVVTFKISPDSKRVAYITSENSIESRNLYSVSIIGGNAIQLNSSTDEGVGFYSFDTTGEKTLYHTTSLFNGPLFSVPTLGGSPIKINENVQNDWKIIPDTGKVIYQALEGNSVGFNSDDTYLYASPITGGSPTKLSNEKTFDFKVSADNKNVVYSSSSDIFTVAISGGNSTKLDPTPEASTDSEIRGYSISDDGRYVIAAAQTNNAPEFTSDLLVYFPIEGGDATKIATSIDGFGDGDHSVFNNGAKTTTNNKYVVFAEGDDRLPGRTLNITLFKNKGSSQEINNSVNNFAVTQDGKFLIYRSEGDLYGFNIEDTKVVELNASALSAIMLLLGDDD